MTSATEIENREEELAAPEPVSQPVSVDIYDQVYRLRGTDPAYIEKLASIVDEKMRAVSAYGTTVDSMRVAVLASINIADELLRLQQRYDALAGNVARSVEEAQQGFCARAGSLAGMLDEVLDERLAG